MRPANGGDERCGTRRADDSALAGWRGGWQVAVDGLEALRALFVRKLGLRMAFFVRTLGIGGLWTRRALMGKREEEWKGGCRDRCAARQPGSALD